MNKRFQRWGKDFKRWWKSEQKSIRIILFIFALVVVVIFSIVFGYRAFKSSQPDKLGVSFSIKYARELNNDWQANYLALLDDAGIRHFRLMSYWDEIESENNQLNFDELDWQMDQAASRGATVSLAVGQRQPRWPECHIPDWAKQLDTENYEPELLEFLVAVVFRYKDHPALESYQLENEAANRHFGDCPVFNNQFLEREFSLVKKLDSKHPVIINTSNQSGIPLINGVGDKVGFSVYKHAYFEALGRQFKWSYDYLPAWWHSLRAGVVEGLHGTETFVHELQAEPWGPVPTVQMTQADQDQLMNSEKLLEHVQYARRTGMNHIDLWGGEWWYYRLTNFNDQQLWQTIENLYSE